MLSKVFGELNTLSISVHSQKEKSILGRSAVRLEVEERDRVREELCGVKAWLEEADALLSELDLCSSTEELQVGDPSDYQPPSFPLELHLCISYGHFHR